MTPQRVLHLLQECLLRCEGCARSAEYLEGPGGQGVQYDLRPIYNDTPQAEPLLVPMPRGKWRQERGAGYKLRAARMRVYDVLGPC